MLAEPLKYLKGTSAMRLTTIPLGPDNLNRCTDLWGDRADYTPGDMRRMLERARDLLRTRRALGRLIVDEHDQPVGFGLATFITPDLSRLYRQAPYPQLGKQLLLQELTVEHIVLDEAAIGRGNATSGLHLVVLNQGFAYDRFSATQFQPLAGTMLQAFADCYRGYRLESIVTEIFGEEGIQLLASAGGGADMKRFERQVASGAVIRSGVLCLDRETAERTYSPHLPLFTYGPPRLLLSGAERRIVQAALGGQTDRAVSEQLKLPLTTVKATWRRIQAKAERDAGLQATLGELRGEGLRGQQSRHIILDYVRSYPSELTPYTPGTERD